MGLCFLLFGSEAKFLRLPTRHEEFFGGAEGVGGWTHRAEFLPRGDLHEVFGHLVFADEDGDGLTQCPFIESFVVEVFFLAITSRFSVGRVAVDDAVARNFYILEVRTAYGQAMFLFVRERGREVVDTVNRVKMANFHYFTIFPR